MDKKWMKRAIELAKKGKGFVAPNPAVGAVILKDGKLIGEGYHMQYGQAHAEINAIKSVKSSCKDATIYVTLEPCSHYGKTPPCVDAIIKEGFKRVVIGMIDPNPKVAGKSISKLRAHGIDVDEGVCQEECEALNPAFIKAMTKKAPYIVLKTGMSLDGKIATKYGESQWITSEPSRAYVHELRHELDGIMVGINTVLVDDPMLTARREERSAHPIRIIVDSKARLPLDSKIAMTAHEVSTIVATTEEAPLAKVNDLEKMGVRVIKTPSKDNHVDLPYLMSELYQLNIHSILLEGGGQLNDSAVQSGIVDEIISFIAPIIIGGKEALSPVSGVGVETLAQAMRLEGIKITQYGDDICIRGKVVKACSQD